MPSHLQSTRIAWTRLPSLLLGTEVTIKDKADEYRGIWYQNRPLKNEYKFRYSGGLGTYCAKQKPFAVYSPQAQKAFFATGTLRPITTSKQISCEQE